MNSQSLILIMTISVAIAACESSTPLVDKSSSPAQSTFTGGAIVPLVMHRNMILAQVRVNGTDANFFMVDSGSTLAVLDQSLAQKLEVTPFRTVRIRGIGGTALANLVKLNDLTIGNVNLGSPTAAVIDLSAFRKTLGWPIMGVIGYTNLKSRPFAINYRDRTLTIFDRDRFQPPVNAHANELRIRDGLLAVKMRIAGEQPIWIQLDTGANGWLSLPVSYVLKHPSLMAGKFNQQVPSHGFVGQVTDIRSELDSITLFGVELRKVPFTADLPPCNDPESVSQFGRLGNRLLKSFTLTFDCPNRTLWTQFNPSAQ